MTTQPERSLASRLLDAVTHSGPGYDTIQSQPADPVEPDDPTAYALAAHIADHPISTIQNAFRYLGWGLTITAVPEEET